MKNSNLLLILLFLAGCTGNAPTIQPIEVDVPIAISCQLPVVQEPDWHMKHLASNAPTTEQLKAILKDMILSRIYIEKLKAAMSACA